MAAGIAMLGVGAASAHTASSSPYAKIDLKGKKMASKTMQSEGNAAQGGCQVEITRLRRRQARPNASALRIALFSGNYNCVRDGANRALNRLVRHLLDCGAAVRVYSPSAPKPAFDPVGDLVSVPSFGIPGRPEYRIAPRLPGRLRDDVRTFRPTHFHLSAPTGWERARNHSRASWVCRWSRACTRASRHTFATIT